MLQDPSHVITPCSITMFSFARKHIEAFVRLMHQTEPTNPGTNMSFKELLLGPPSGHKKVEPQSLLAVI